LIDKLKTIGAKIKTTADTIQISYIRPQTKYNDGLLPLGAFTQDAQGRPYGVQGKRSCCKTPKRKPPAVRTVNSARSIHTAPYPGFPTDLQSQFAVLSCVTKGRTTITESIFENRFRYAAELQKLGAKISINANRAEITGVPALTAVSTPHICPIAYMKNPPPICDGLELSAADLRGGVALVIAGLAAIGTTTITNAEYIYRGHADIVRDLVAVGANIIRVE
jgi:UDP-N-acetylglucosamine 1-carboxyvinyltransferase